MASLDERYCEEDVCECKEEISKVEDPCRCGEDQCPWTKDITEVPEPPCLCGEDQCQCNITAVPEPPCYCGEKQCQCNIPAPEPRCLCGEIGCKCNIPVISEPPCLCGEIQCQCNLPALEPPCLCGEVQCQCNIVPVNIKKCSCSDILCQCNEIISDGPSVECKPVPKSQLDKTIESYFKEHRIQELFEMLFVHILINMPDDPVLFLQNLLKKLLVYRDENTEPPLIYEDRHLESLYRTMDIFDTGCISVQQFYSGLRTLGIKNYTGKPTLDRCGLVTKAVFKTVASSCLIKAIDDVIVTREWRGWHEILKEPEVTDFFEEKELSNLVDLFPDSENIE